MSTYIQYKLRILLVVVLPLFSFISADAITPSERKFQFQYKRPSRIYQLEQRILVFGYQYRIQPVSKIKNLKIESPYKYQIHTS